jgi:hypothetical protein
MNCVDFAQSLDGRILRTVWNRWNNVLICRRDHENVVDDNGLVVPLKASGQVKGS